jgi:A/G-specific adenine glycosylase
MGSKNIEQIQKNILTRYKKHGRKLPRRQLDPAKDGAMDPYAIHVSEVMLQQTQVDRVIPYFLQWMKDYPDYKSLAKTSKSDLLKHRSGL